MSSSRQICDGRRQGKAIEKSNFAHTCNLLSHYIKNKGSLGDLNLEIGGKVESLEAIVKPRSSHSASASTTMKISTHKGKSHQSSTEQHPSIVPDSCINTLDDASTSKEGTTTDQKTAPLTIFYSGRVLVFDGYPSDKAKELVAFAKKSSSQMSCGILSKTLGKIPTPCEPRPKGFIGISPNTSLREGLPPRPRSTAVSPNTLQENANGGAAAQVAASSGTEKRDSQQSEANGSDLPIARRSSLNRFLGKRKDRAYARGPYQVQEQQRPSSS